MLTDNEKIRGYLYIQKESLQEPSAFDMHKLMKCIIRIAQLFYARWYVKDEMKKYILADGKEIIMPPCRNIAQYASIQKI